MLPSNKPRLAWHVKIIAPKHASHAVCVLSTDDREGQEVRLRSWEWTTGRPSASELADLAAAVMADIESTIVTFIGVQEELP